MKTTLNAIRKHKPCADGWEKLLSYLGKTKADDEPLSLVTILDSNGLEDAIWCLRAVEGNEKEIRLFAVWCARQVQHLLTDQRSIDALDVAERYALGKATEDELKAASGAALDAVWAASGAAMDAARAAYWAAAWSAARSAVWAARTAYWAAVAVAAWAAARAAARTARTAYWAAAAVAAWAAARAAARTAARAAAHQEMRSRQETELRRICEGE